MRPDRRSSARSAPATTGRLLGVAPQLWVAPRHAAACSTHGSSTPSAWPRPSWHAIRRQPSGLRGAPRGCPSPVARSTCSDWAWRRPSRSQESAPPRGRGGVPCGLGPGGRQDGRERAPRRRPLGKAGCWRARPGSAALSQRSARDRLRRRGSQRARRNSDRAVRLVPRAGSRCSSMRTVARRARLWRSRRRVAPRAGEPGRPVVRRSPGHVARPCGEPGLPR